MLSPQEQKTIESYKIIAQNRNKTHGNPEFWRPEFETLTTYLQCGIIIDIGCGGGRDALLFREADYPYIGIDLSEEMISQAKELAPNMPFLVMSMYDLKLPRNAFDGFWAAASLLHIPKNNIDHVLGEVKRVVRPGGVGFISLKHGSGEKMIKESSGAERFFAFYTEKEFSNILLESGLEILESALTREIWLTYFVKVL